LPYLAKAKIRNTSHQTIQQYHTDDINIYFFNHPNH
jgi:hypothetical protein